MPLLLAVAVVGYLAGLHRVSSSGGQSPAAGMRVASGVNVLLEYPAGWERAPASSARGPALQLGSHSLSLVPRGHSSSAGLLSGVLALDGASPLPSRLLASQHGVPHTEVVNLDAVQAFRYRQLIVPGYTGTVELYVVPTPNDGATALACYASPDLQSELAKCEQIVASLTLVGQSTSDLTPDGAYASRLSGLLKTLEAERRSLRLRLSRGAAATSIAGAAGSLGARFASTSTSLATLEPPAVAGPAQVALARSLLGASVAYKALAAAAQAESLTRYQQARTQVSAAEAGVDGALESFALLGYSHGS